MGGMPPLGYDVVDRKLVPNVIEAARVRRIFERYIALGSMTTLARELRAEGVTTKSWTTLKDKTRAGKLIDKGYLYKSSEPVFIGVAAYKGKHFAGEHEAIGPAVGRGAGDAGPREPKNGSAEPAMPSPCPLKLIFADDGWAMTPGATYKNDKVYRYYVNTASIKIARRRARWRAARSSGGVAQVRKRRRPR
jgi:hypothetical protein